MKRLVLICLSVLLCLNLYGRGKDLKFNWGLGFETLFDNREYDFSLDGTIFGTKLSPGLSLQYSSGKTRHTLNAEYTFLKDFGSPYSENELALWYDMNLRLNPKTELGLDFGIFPFSLVEEDWSTAFFSEEKLWYDKYVEGILISLRRPKSNIVLGVNWDGKIGSTPSTRERFNIFSTASSNLFANFTIGYQLNAVHFANSLEVRGVVDNVLLSPYMSYSFNELIGKRSNLKLKAAYIFAYQRDRMAETINPSLAQTTNHFPSCAEFVVSLTKYAFSFDNRFYYGVGSSIMPFYYLTDTAGIVYGERLYSGDPFFARCFDENSRCYDRMELSWQPQIVPNLNLKVSAIFHFRSGFDFVGSQQRIGLVFKF